MPPPFPVAGMLQPSAMYSALPCEYRPLGAVMSIVCRYSATHTRSSERNMSPFTKMTLSTQNNITVSSTMLRMQYSSASYHHCQPASIAWPSTNRRHICYSSGPGSLSHGRAVVGIPGATYAPEHSALHVPRLPSQTIPTVPVQGSPTPFSLPLACHAYITLT